MIYDVLIIGAGPAGLTAGIYARRAGKSVLIIESGAFGGQIVNTSEIENYPAIKKISGYEFSMNLVEQAMDLGAEIESDEVVDVTFGDEITLKTTFNTFKGKTLIIATGAYPRKLGAVNEEKFLGAGVSYCAICDGAFFKGKDVALQGGGNSALEEAIYLSNICNKVYLVHRREGFRADNDTAEKVKALKNVELILNYNITEIKGEGKVDGVVVTNALDGSKKDIKVDGVFVSIGRAPSTKLFENKLDLNESGYILADESCKTKYKNVFVAGDVRVKSFRQLTTAVADGTVSCMNAVEYLGKNC